MTPDETVLDLSALDREMPSDPAKCAEWIIRIAGEKKRLNEQLLDIQRRETYVLNQISSLDKTQRTLIQRFAAKVGVSL